MAVTAASRTSARDDLAARARRSRERLTEATARLVRAASPNPPGDTGAVAEVAADLLREGSGIEVELAPSRPPIVNVIARLRGSGDGRRLVFNGHLDTFPVGDAATWSVDPLGALCKDGRLYGRGATDMKGGVAASILATLLLAETREAWPGEIVVTLAGDEESMGPMGTSWLLERYPHATGDAMITGDAGSPDVLRFGEKGMIWLELEADGRSAHGAHVHLGVSAIERLLAALNEIFGLRDRPVALPAEVERAIADAAAVSEAVSGQGESDTLRRITVNCGLIRGGSLGNLVADNAAASVDIRLPAGVGVAEIEDWLEATLGRREGVRHATSRSFEPLWSPPDHEIVACLKRAGREALGRAPVANYRVGASDARLYRLRGVPSVVCGPTPHNMGAADEYADIDELCAVAYMHALAAFDFLTGPSAGTGGGA